MSVLPLVLVSALGYLIAYYTYGRFIARKIVQLSSRHVTPAHQFNDGKDFVPTKRHVLFGHHFTSIAGTGPIVGPAIGVIWGWVPALLWVFFGSIFIGAVHDFTTLVVSMRHDGKSIAEITASIINPRVRALFFMVVFLALLIVIAIFGLVIAVIFNLFPESVFPIWMEIPIAIMVGYVVYQKGISLRYATVAGVIAMYITVIIGHFIPLRMPELLSIPPTGLWTILLLLYALIASVLPVTTLLQPRDYLNAWQLYIALGLLILGIIVTSLSTTFTIPAPAINLSPDGAPSIWPFIFITIACGAISGFHSLVSSGTSAKQIQCESDAQFIGFGSMLLEAFLATIVIITVTAGLGMAYTTADGTLLTGVSAWNAHYGSWLASQGLASKIHAVVIGSSNILSSLGIPTELGVIIMGVFIASFAATTLDSATRVQRYIISELVSQTSIRLLLPLKKPLYAALLAVLTGAALAFSSGLNGKGALALWPLFGAVNQLLATLALSIGTLYLRRRGGWAFLITGIPWAFMAIITLWATLSNQFFFMKSDHLLLAIINGIIFSLALIIIAECLIIFKRQSNA